MIIDYNSEIIEGSSIGNISINYSVNQCLNAIKEQNKRLDVDTFSEDYTEYNIDGGIVSFVGNNQNGTIETISCNQFYTGKFKNIFHIGMTVNDIIELDVYTIILHGFLMIDRSLNIGYNLPNILSDYDYINELPSDLELNKLYIMKTDWWK